MGSAASAQGQLHNASEAELSDLVKAAPELLRCRLPPQQLEAFAEAMTRVAREEKPQDMRAAWQRPSSWPAKKTFAAPGKAAMHVVLSTKFAEPWLTISIGIKEILIERGCTVYNPNTDNAEMYAEEANDRWLLTFNEHLQKVKDTKGFVLQIQQGAQRDRSYMQLAEEKQSAWLQVPRIGLFAFPTTKTRGGGSLGEQYLEKAMEAARRQWATKIRPEVEMVSEVYEPLGAEQLPLDEDGLVHGRARCTWPDSAVYEGELQHGKMHGRGIYKYANGAVYEGEFQEDKMHGRGIYKYANGAVYEGEYQEGKMHGRGIFKWADGEVYEGEWQEDKRHGRGIFKWADGAVETGLYEQGKDKGPGVKLSADRKEAWLLRDGEEERELSVSEARGKAKELGLLELPP